MNDTISITAVLALVLNLLAVVHYGTRLRRDLVEQIKADEKRWADHETRLALVEQSLTTSQVALNAGISSMKEHLEQMNELLFNLLSDLLEKRPHIRPGGTRKNQ